MSGATYASPAGRRNEVKGEILGHAVVTEVLGITGQNKKMPTKEGKTIVYRRWLPYGGATTNSTTINQWVVTAAAHALQEGVNPNPDSLTAQDITVVMQQYGCLYSYTDVQDDLHEDDLPPEMKRQVGERMGLVREMIRYGALKQCTNKFYAGGTSRATVDEAVSKNLLRRVSRSLGGNGAVPITKVLAASPGFNTSPVQEAYLVFGHTDCEHDFRELENFIPVANYGSRKPVHQNEIGSVDNFRFILSRHLSAVADSGAAVGSTGLYSTSASNIDVYPIVVVGEDAWGDVALRGRNSFDYTDIKPNSKEKIDPLGLTGYVGAKFYSAATVLNDGHMAVIEAGITSLS